VGIGGLLLAAGAILASGAISPVERRVISATTLTVESTSTVSAKGAATPSVEVPDVRASSVEEAQIVLKSVGFDVRSTGDPGPADEVTEQDPAPGTLLVAGSVVSIAARRHRSSEASDGSAWVVVIDPGHQRRSDMTPEPVGPGATETKPRVTGGTTGAVSGMSEYEVVLQISTNLKERLESAGVKVIMTRTTNDVNISNAERAALANEAEADLFVRVHCDGNPDPTVSGMSTLYPSPSNWTKAISGASYRAAGAIQKEAVAETGAVDRGIKPRDDLSGFNHSRVPSVLVECGFMSHPIEDRLLTSPHYQDKLASGIERGILSYLTGSDL
jgi:N-acetylmuramoyl-L-alanine amidase